jgi:hypothetical protein
MPCVSATAARASSGASSSTCPPASPRTTRLSTPRASRSGARAHRPTPPPRKIRPLSPSLRTASGTTLRATRRSLRRTQSMHRLGRRAQSTRARMPAWRPSRRGRLATILVLPARSITPSRSTITSPRLAITVSVRARRSARDPAPLMHRAPAVVPVTVLPMNEDTNSTDIPYHPTYKGEVLFANKFSGQLPASDYPKVTVSWRRAPCRVLADAVLVLLCNVPCVPCPRRRLGMALLQALTRPPADPGAGSS